MTTCISIVEDNDKTRQILAEMVARAPTLTLVSQYGRCEQAIAGLPREKPDVVLMDINLPGINGVECVRTLKPLMPRTQFLMLTVYEDADHIFAALKAGATGYLIKGTRRTVLINAIQQIREGGSPMSSGIARKVVQSFSQADVADDDANPFSPREQTVLALLTKGYLYKEISDLLGLSIPTINTHIRHIYEKLQVHSRAQAVAKYLKQIT